MSKMENWLQSNVDDEKNITEKSKRRAGYIHRSCNHNLSIYAEIPERNNGGSISNFDKGRVNMTITDKQVQL